MPPESRFVVPTCGPAGCGPAGVRVMLRDVAFGEDRGFRFVQCLECGMGYVDPWPTAEQVDALYSADYTYYVPDGVSGSSRLKLFAASLRYADRVDGGMFGALRSAAGRLIEVAAGRTISYSLGVPLRLDRGAAILDYGCGTGEWLRGLRRIGYRNLSGFDIAANPTFTRALEAHGIRAFDREGLDSIPGGSFDLVRLEHVLEHLRDPIGDLSRLRRLLRSGGWLVLTVPSILPWEGVANLEASPHVAHMQIPVHLVLHSPKSLRRIAEAAGFRVEGELVTRGERFLSAALREGIRGAEAGELPAEAPS